MYQLYSVTYHAPLGLIEVRWSLHVPTGTVPDAYSEVVGTVHSINKAIKDGKYLAPPHASAWQPIKMEKFDIFRDVISLLARVFILLIDMWLPKRFP